MSTTRRSDQVSAGHSPDHEGVRSPEGPITVEGLATRINGVATRLGTQRPDLFGDGTVLGDGLRSRAMGLRSEFGAIGQAVATTAEVARVDVVRGWVSDVEAGVQQGRESRRRGGVGELTVVLTPGHGEQGALRVSPDSQPMGPDQFVAGMEETGPMPTDTYNFYNEQHRYALDYVSSQIAQQLAELANSTRGNDAALQVVADGLSRYFLGAINQVLAQIEARLGEGVAGSMGRLSLGRGKRQLDELTGLVQQLVTGRETFLLQIRGQLAHTRLIPSREQAARLIKRAINDYTSRLNAVLGRAIADVGTSRAQKVGRGAEYRRVVVLTSEVAGELKALLESGVDAAVARKRLLRKYHSDGSTPDLEKYATVIELTSDWHRGMSREQAGL